MTISINNKNETNYVYFPFELKDNFRENFKSAKWHAERKCWTLPESSAARLEQWKAEVEASGVLDAIADRSHIEMTEREIENLRADLVVTKRKVSAADAEAARLIALREEKEGLLEQLRAERETLNADEGAKQEAEKAVVDAAVEIESELGSLIDKKALIGTINEIYRVAEVRKAWASQKAAELQARLKKQFAPLRDAGWTIHGVTRVYNASSNKLTRELCNDAERALNSFDLVKIEE